MIFKKWRPEQGTAAHTSARNGGANPELRFGRASRGWFPGEMIYEDGVFAVVWTLAQAIKLNPGGINAPMQVAMLTTRGGKPHARLLDAGEIAEHEANVEGAIEHLRQYRQKVRGAGAVEIPRVEEVGEGPLPARREPS